MIMSFSFHLIFLEYFSHTRDLKVGSWLKSVRQSCKAEKTMRRIERSKPFENMLYLSGRKDAGGVSCLDYHQEQKLLQNR